MVFSSIRVGNKVPNSVRSQSQRMGNLNMEVSYDGSFPPPQEGEKELGVWQSWICSVTIRKNEVVASCQ